MAEQDTDLPEGTDTVVTGAENTGNGGATNSAGSSGGGTIAGTQKSGGGGDTGNGLLDKVRSGSEKLSGQAADKAKDLLGQCLERSADALNNVGKLVADPAQILAGVEPAGFNHLPVVGEHAAEVVKLPAIHKDPFDRILVAQARVEPMVLLTDDGALGGYGDLVEIV